MAATAFPTILGRLVMAGAMNSSLFRPSCGAVFGAGVALQRYEIVAGP